MKVYELLKELPHDKFMPLLLGVCETARSVAIEALSDTENYPKIVECLAKANDRLGGFCNPRVVSDSADSKFFATATVWVIANYHPCIFERTLTTDIVLDDNVPLTEAGERMFRAGMHPKFRSLLYSHGLEYAEHVRDCIIDIIATNGAEAVRQYATAVESRLAYISKSDDLYARQENILLMRDKERLDSLLSQ